MANPWFRMYSEFATDAKVQMMNEVMQRRYIMLMCLRCSNDLVTLHDEEIAFQLRISVDDLAETKGLFIKKGFIDKSWNLLNWDKRQFSSDTSKGRVAKHRTLQKEKQAESGNDTVTLQKQQANGLDTEQNRTEETNVSVGKAALPACRTEEVVALYHEVLPEMPRIKLMNDARRKAIGAFWKFVMTSKKSDDTPRAETAEEALSWIHGYFNRTRDNDFLMGRGKKATGHESWQCDLDFLLTEKGKRHVIEKNEGGIMSLEQLRNETIEAAALSILINFPVAFDDVSDRLRPEHFAVDDYRAIYAELCRQMAVGKGCDLVSIVDALDGVVAASEIMAVSSYNDYSARGIGRHVQTLVDMYKARQLHSLSHTLAELAYDTAPIQDRVDKAQMELAKLDDVDQEDDWVDAHTAAIEHLDLLEARQDGKIGGIPSGLIDFDEILDGGMYRGNMVVIGARPAMGKTALGMTIGLHMAQTYAVGFNSLEMPHNDVRDRQSAILSRASIGMIKRPAKGLEYDRIVDGVERAKTLRWYVSAKSGLTILQVRSKARTLKRRKGLDVLIVDYIGIMNGLDSKQSRAYQIEEISRGLKSLAKELDIVVVCLAQVNRGGVERVGQIPGLQDLRDSGSIEQDADVVAFIHRPIEAQPELGAAFANYALLRVAKNRQGRTGDVHLFYNGQFTVFESWSGPPPQKMISGKKGGFE